MIVPSLVPTKPCMIVNPRIRLRTDHMTSMINFTFPNGIPVLVCMASMRPSAASSEVGFQFDAYAECHDGATQDE